MCNGQRLNSVKRAVFAEFGTAQNQQVMFWLSVAFYIFKLFVMKKKAISAQKFLFWAMLIMILPMLGACQKDGGIDQEGTINLKDISENPEYANLPLIGTTWKLIGFANTKTGKVKTVKLGSPQSYSLYLTDDREIWGHTSANTVKGKYELFDKEANNIKVLAFTAITYVNEMGEPIDYYEAMKKVDRFHVTTRGLSLYYDSESFLLFKPHTE